MSIQEILKKSKDFWVSFLENDELFTVVLLLLVGTAAFGLGRVSMMSGEVREAVLVETPAAAIEAEAGAAPAATGTLQGKFVASRNSDKYHLPWCSGAKRIKEENKIWFDSEGEARAAGYAPAANCPGL